MFVMPDLKINPSTLNEIYLDLRRKRTTTTLLNHLRETKENGMAIREVSNLLGTPLLSSHANMLILYLR